MNDLIRNQIETYRTRSADLLISQQKVYIPRLESDQIEFVTQKYVVNVDVKLVPLFTHLCLKLRYIYLSENSRYIADSYYNSLVPMVTLINNRVIKPFMIFVNGVFIPLECIQIVINYNSIYALIHDIDGTLKDVIIDPQYIQTITLPEHFEYISKRSNANFISNDPEIYPLRFTKEGLYGGDYCAFKNNNRDLTSIHERIFTSNKENSTTSYIEEDRNLRWSNNNILIFNNTGLLSVGEKRNINIYQEENDSVVIRPSNAVLTANPSIIVTSNIFRITNAKPGVYYCLTFVGNKYDSIIDNEVKVDESFIENIISSNTSHRILEQLNLTVDENLSSDDNVNKMIMDVLNYNASLLTDCIKEKSEIIIENIPIESILANRLKMQLHHNASIDEKVLLFVNGLLKNKSYNTFYNNNTVIIEDIIDSPKDIKNSEIIRFTNVNNNVYDIIITSDNDFSMFDSAIFNKDMVLLSPQEHSQNFDFSEEKYQMFPIDFTFTDGKFILDDEFYYDKPLKLAYRNRFAHLTCKIQEELHERDFAIDLQDTFLYCYDYNKFNVFYNGRKLDKDYYRMVVPNNPNTPFIDFKVYIRIPLSVGDTIDVVYTPIELEEFKIIPTIPANGSINIETDTMNVPFNKDLCMIWINGKKVHNSHIYNINSRHVKIIEDEDTINNVSIIQYIPPIDVISNWGDIDNLWDTITTIANEDELFNIILGISSSDILHDNETNLIEINYNVRSILNELIRDQYINSFRADITKAIIFDYPDKSIVEVEDGDGIINTANSSRTDENIGGITRFKEET